jgi:hypothetical protein
MAYTDLWRCKHCNVLPDIQMIGRSFLIACDACVQRDARVEGESLSEVVSKWNALHEPPKPVTGLMGRLKAWGQILKDSAEYHRDCLREKRERSVRLKQSLEEIKEAEGEKTEPLLDEETVSAHQEFAPEREQEQRREPHRV